MTVSPFTFVTVNTLFGSRFGTICPVPSGTERCLSQPARSWPLNRGCHWAFGWEKSGSAAKTIVPMPEINRMMRNAETFAHTDRTVRWATRGSPSPRPSPLGRGRMVHTLSITPVPEIDQQPLAKHQPDACCSLSLRERGKYSVAHAECSKSQGLLSTPCNSNRVLTRSELVVMPKCYKKLAQTKGKLFNRITDMTRQTPPVRIGIIGCGNVLSAYRASLDKLRMRGAAKAVMACGRDSQRASACTDLRMQRFTTDAQEVIDSRDVDAVIILTSMPEHARLTRAALEAGKHVLVEKPLATTLDES